MVIYAAAKGALNNMTRNWAKEFAPRGITVNAIAPGYITTAMVNQLPEDVQSGILSRIPMGRFGNPDDVAEMVTFLCTDAAGYVTGQVIGIDGGLAV